jgi:hypothetical protein
LLLGTVWALRIGAGTALLLGTVWALRIGAGAAVLLESGGVWRSRTVMEFLVSG